MLFYSVVVIALFLTPNHRLLEMQTKSNSCLASVKFDKIALANNLSTQNATLCDYKNVT